MPNYQTPQCTQFKFSGRLINAGVHYWQLTSDKFELKDQSIYHRVGAWGGGGEEQNNFVREQRGNQSSLTEYKKGGGEYECQLTVNEGGIIGI